MWLMSIDDVPSFVLRDFMEDGEISEKTLGLLEPAIRSQVENIVTNYRTASLATTGAGASAQPAETETPILIIPFTGTARPCGAVSSSSSLNVPTRTQRWQP